ncbi:MAG: DUF1080 domain-containing protein [Bacteroidota bacterium]
MLYAASGCGGQSGALHVPDKVEAAPLPSFSPIPEDALVLFDGTSLEAWQQKNGKEARWRLKEDYMEVRRWTGSLYSKAAFGDIQLHAEWATPARGIGRGQHKGNSGIKLMGLYEIQILDSYSNETHPDGQAGAVYSQYPPLVNASRPPGAWQSFDIVFRRPRFTASGALESPAYLTVFHNGILIQDQVSLKGPTKGNSGYTPHADQLPIMLQNHRSKVRFRNIWVRKLEQ